MRDGDARRRQRARRGRRAPLILARLALTAALLLPAAPFAAGLSLVDHPLAGRIWDPGLARPVEAAEAEKRLLAADVVLLGETHDNSAHHELQRRLLARLLERGRRPVLGLEQVDTEHQVALDRARAEPGATPQEIGRAASVAPGWRWSFYEPLVALALEYGLPLVALNLSRARARQVVAEGTGRLGEGEAERLALDAAWSPQRGEAMRALLVSSHCGDDSPLIDRMVVMQRARDAVMADRIAAHTDRGVVAIVGRGHARADLGVPIYLRARFPRLAVASVGFVEVTKEGLRPEDYPEAERGRHDLVWFTPRAVRDDPCKPVAPGAGRGRTGGGGGAEPASGDDVRR